MGFDFGSIIPPTIAKNIKKSLTDSDRTRPAGLGAPTLRPVSGNGHAIVNYLATDNPVMGPVEDGYYLKFDPGNPLAVDPEPQGVSRTEWGLEFVDNGSDIWIQAQLYLHPILTFNAPDNEVWIYTSLWAMDELATISLFDTISIFHAAYGDSLIEYNPVFTHNWRGSAESYLPIIRGRSFTVGVHVQLQSEGDPLPAFAAEVASPVPGLGTITGGYA